MKKNNWDQYCIWWLSEGQFRLMGEPGTDFRRPGHWRPYIWSSFYDAWGRAGRGRLWVPEFFETDGIPDEILESDDWKWKSRNLKIDDCAGIVIKRCHAHQVAPYSGFITDVHLDFIQLRSGVQINKTCLVCKKSFFAIVTARTCSQACRKKLSRAKGAV